MKNNSTFESFIDYLIDKAIIPALKIDNIKKELKDDDTNLNNTENEISINEQDRKKIID